MANLINTLKKETETLRVQYLAMTEEYAANFFNHVKNEMVKYGSKEFRSVKESNPSEYYRLQKLVHGRYATIYFGGLEKFIGKEVKNAEMHYEDSIVKLADRIEKKELNQEKITVATSHIGVNINTTLTDGEKTVKAFTIIASGPIQRPHYRYLIK